MRAVGELDPNQSKSIIVQEIDIEDYSKSQDVATSVTSYPKDASTADIEDVKIDYRTYRPEIPSKEWVVSETDLCESVGCHFKTILKYPGLSFHYGGMWDTRHCKHSESVIIELIRS